MRYETAYPLFFRCFIIKSVIFTISHLKNHLSYRNVMLSVVEASVYKVDRPFDGVYTEHSECAQGDSKDILRWLKLYRLLRRRSSQ